MKKLILIIDYLRKNIPCFLGGAGFNLKNVIRGARIGWDVHNNNRDGTATPSFIKMCGTRLLWNSGYKIYS